MTLIKTITPKHDTFNFPVDGQIHIEFIDLMNPNSLLREDAVYLETSGARVPVEREVKNGRNLSLIPKEPLKHETTYFITFNGYEDGIEDFSRSPLRAKEVLYFGTEVATSEDDSSNEGTPPENEDPTETPPPEEPTEESIEEPKPPIDEDFNEGVVSSSIYLEKAYPDNGKVLNTGSPIVLIFCEELEPVGVQ